MNELGSGHLNLEALLEKTTSVLLLQGRPDPEELLSGADVDTDSFMVQANYTTFGWSPKLPKTSCPGGTFHTGRQVNSTKTHSTIPQTLTFLHSFGLYWEYKGDLDLILVLSTLAVS